MSSRASLLVIDDELGMREMLSYELAQEGFEVETAASGMAAVEAVRRRKFDLAVTDLKMPGMDGVATLAALREIDPDIEVIVATGYATVETAVACMKRGAYDYIQKPYDLTELKLLLERAMQKSHLQGVVALYEASRVLLTTLRPAELVRIVLDLAQRVLRADDVALVLWQDGVAHVDTHRLAGRTRPSDALLLQLAQRAVATGSALRIPSAAAPQVPEEGAATADGAALVYPLAGRQRSLGALAIWRNEGAPEFSQSELQKGSVFASQLALALDNARLYEELEEKIQQLVHTRDQLVQAEKLALAGQLAGAVAHEINNPLGYVQANLDALRDYSTAVGALWLSAKAAALYLRDLHVPAAERHARSFSVVDDSEDRTECLIRDIAEVVDETLDGVRRIAELVSGFRRLAEPSDVAPRERIDVAALARECVAELTRRPEHLRTIACEVEACETYACGADLHLALLNILASLCVERGGGEQSGISLRVGLEGGRPAIVIVDDAVTLSEEERRRLFDPRVEVDSRQGRTMRLNLSLALAHAMLARNGAAVFVEAPGDRGVRFRIVLAELENTPQMRS